MPALRHRQGHQDPALRRRFGGGGGAAAGGADPWATGGQPPAAAGGQAVRAAQGGSRTRGPATGGGTRVDEPPF